MSDILRENLVSYPPDLDVQINIDAPVFAFEGKNYLMVGADKTHEDVTTTPMSFSAQRTQSGLEIRSRVLSDIELGGLVVSHLVVDTDWLVKGVTVTERGDRSRDTSIETTEGLRQLSYGAHDLGLGETFDSYIGMVFSATLARLFIPRKEPSSMSFLENISDDERKRLAEIARRQAERVQKPVFYYYDPEKRKAKRI